MSVPARFSPEVLLQAQDVRLAIFDVDGVLTDGRLYYGAEGEAFKVFHVLDGHGLKLLSRFGITPAVITGRDHPALRRRLADLGVTHAYYGVADKDRAAQDLLSRMGCGWEACAAMGDDWPDLGLLQRARFACAPPQAHPDVLQVVHHVTRAGGGQGAVRECCDLLLMAAGAYGRALREHHVTLDQPAQAPRA